MQTTLKIEPVQPKMQAASITVVEPEDVLRADCYALLGALLTAPPTRAVIDAIQSIQRIDADDGAAMARAWHSLRLAGESAADLAALDDEHHALFVGVGRGELMPYASWYLTGFLMEQPLAALRRALKELGFE
ncbi:MAG: TorD/DmsD family molecular chaperone, partial [Gammaproteobacteria bacterium]